MYIFEHLQVHRMYQHSFQKMVVQRIFLVSFRGRVRVKSNTMSLSSPRNWKNLCVLFEYSMYTLFSIPEDAPKSQNKLSLYSMYLSKEV